MTSTDQNKTLAAPAAPATTGTKPTYIILATGLGVAALVFAMYKKYPIEKTAIFLIAGIGAGLMISYVIDGGTASNSGQVDTTKTV